jgi:hypothetical protein
MAAVVPIVLADALGTPVNHIFTPLGPDSNGVWWFEDQSQASPIGYWRLSISLKRPPPAANGVASSSSRVSRCKVAMHMPVLETLGNNSSGIIPPPTVAYVERSSTEFILAERDTPQNRKDMRKMSMNLLANALVVDMVENLINTY